MITEKELNEIAKIEKKNLQELSIKSGKNKAYFYASLFGMADKKSFYRGYIGLTASKLLLENFPRSVRKVIKDSRICVIEKISSITYDDVEKIRNETKKNQIEFSLKLGKTKKHYAVVNCSRKSPPSLSFLILICEKFPVEFQNVFGEEFLEGIIKTANIQAYLDDEIILQEAA